MSSISPTAAQDLLARFPALVSHPSGAERVAPGSNSAKEQAEQQRQQQLELEAQRYDEDNETLRQQMRLAMDELDLPLKPQGAKSAEERRLALLEEEVLHLETTLMSLRTPALPYESDPLLNVSPIVLDEELHTDIQRTIAELEKGLEWERQRAEKERKKSMRDEVLLSDAEKLNQSLEVRAKVARERKDKVTAQDLIARAEAKAAAVSTAFATLMNALVQFIDDRLAQLGQEDDTDDIAGAKKRAKMNMRDIRTYFKSDAPEGAADDSMDSTTPAGKAHVLKQLLENLMNAAATTPLDPWLTIAGPPPASDSRERYQSVPTELLDFLMRAGVVREHPSDGRRVRLESFGRGIGGE